VAEGKPQVPASAANTTVVVTLSSSDLSGASSGIATSVTVKNPTVTFAANGLLTITNLGNTLGFTDVSILLTYKGPDAAKITDKSKLNQTLTVSLVGSSSSTALIDGNITTPKALGNMTSVLADQTAAASKTDQCASITEIGILGHFVLCPLAQTIISGLNLFYGLIQPLLQVNPLTTQQTDVNGQATGKPSPIYVVWDVIKNIANIALVFIFFIIIFSQATSIGIGGYGIKKILPKLIVGAIAINLSFFACALLVDFFNVAGDGLSGLLNGALSSAGIPTTGTSFAYSTAGPLADLSALGAVAGAGILLIVLAIPIILIALLMFLVGIIALLLRMVLIVLLVVLSPLAFAAWLLPNTDKYFSKWWSTFFRLLLIYPAISLMFVAVTIVLAVIDGIRMSPTTPAAIQPIFLIFSVVILGLPLIAIPFIFKSTGGAMGSMYNWLDAKRKGAQSAYKNSNFEKYRQQRKKLTYGQELTGNYSGNNPFRKVRSKAIRGAYGNTAFDKVTGGFGGYSLDSAIQSRDEAQKRVGQFVGSNPKAAAALLDFAQSGKETAFKDLDESTRRGLRQQARQGVIGGGVNGPATAQIALGALARTGKLTTQQVRNGESIADKLHGDERENALSSMANSIVAGASERGSVQHQNWGVTNGHLDQSAHEPELDTTGAIQKEFKKKAFTDLHYSSFYAGSGGREAFDDLVGRDDGYRESAVKALSDNRVGTNIKEDILAALAVNGRDATGKTTGARMPQMRTSAVKIDPRNGRPIIGPDGNAVANSLKY
jgi:hypothetical protein